MRPVHRLQTALVILLIAGLAPAALHAAEDNVPRTASGHPDLSGTYDAATLTPLERPEGVRRQAVHDPRRGGEDRR